MDADLTQTETVAQTRQRIINLLQDVPSEKLTFLEQFILLLRQYDQLQTTAIKEKADPYMYPTVVVPASSLTKLTGIMPPVGGDALADTESAFDN